MKTLAIRFSDHSVKSLGEPLTQWPADYVGS